MLWLRSLESAQAQPLAGTEGATGTVIWSPEGDWIGFFADGRLKRIRPDGEPPETIAELRGFQEADWGSQGDILFRPRNREPENGGAKIDHRIGGMKPPAGGGKPDRSSGPPSIPRVFCGTREGCIEWSSMRMCGVVSMWKG